MTRHTKWPNIKNLIVINFVDYSLIGLAELNGCSGFGVGSCWLYGARQDEKEWLTILRITLLVVTHPIPLAYLLTIALLHTLRIVSPLGTCPTPTPIKQFTKRSISMATYFMSSRTVALENLSTTIKKQLVICEFSFFRQDYRFFALNSKHNDIKRKPNQMFL